MNLLKDLQELLEAGVITPQVAENISAYYENKKGKPQNRLFIAFGILGAILVGLGIILIIAHNWDDLDQTTKTIFAFLPLIIGQALCGYTLLRKSNSKAWQEGSAAFLFFAVGACLSLISQIYNIPGRMSDLLFTWMLLGLPLVYLLGSSIVSLLFLIGITYYACETGYWSGVAAETYHYWWMFLLILPHYFFLYRKRPTSNFMAFHNWFVPLSLVITLGTVGKSEGHFLFIAYMSLFGLLYMVGNDSFFRNQKAMNNGYLSLGSLGTVILLLLLSFDWVWEDIRDQVWVFSEIVLAPEFITAVITTLLAGAFLFRQWNTIHLYKRPTIEPVFLVFILVFGIGISSPIAAVLINAIVLAIGILTISNGTKWDHLGVLNYGLLIIAALVACRFFDADLSFVARGLLFVLVGIGFFATNYWMLKKRNANE